MSTLDVTAIRSFEEISKIADRGDLYVINNSNLNNQQSRGNVVMDINGDNGNTFPVSLMSTWVPQNIGDQCQPKFVVQSNAFRRLVSRDILIVIPTEEAIQILRRPDVAEELRKVQENAIAYKQNLQSAIPTTDSSKLTLAIGSNPVAPAPIVPVTEQSSLDDNSLYQIVSNFNAGRLSDADGVQALYTLKPSENALKETLGNINDTGSKFYERLTDMLSNLVSPQMN